MKILKNVIAVSCASLLLFAPYNYSVVPKVIIANAEKVEGVTFEDSDVEFSGDGDEVVHLLSGTTTEHHITIESGSHVILLNNVNIDLTGKDDVAWTSPIEVKPGAKCTIILTGENTLKSRNVAGILVGEGAELTIGSIDEVPSLDGFNYGAGILNVDANGDGAGIGGASGATGGNVTISSGTINVTSKWGAGIGGGNNNGNFGNITINDSNVTVTTNFSSAAIGSGVSGVVGNITINNTKVSATNQGAGAGIGGGDGGKVGAIIIENSEVEAISSSGAGIGSGSYECPCESITIKNSSITASGKAGIGGKVTGNIEITNDDGVERTIKATGGSQGAGIGAKSRGNIGDIIIKNVNVIAEGYVGIGSGGDAFGSSVGNIEISGSKVTATGTFSSGIGSSENDTVEKITITDSDITANAGTGGAGIGGLQANNEGIEITNSTVTATGGSGGVGIGSGCYSSNAEVRYNSVKDEYEVFTNNSENPVTTGDILIETGTNITVRSGSTVKLNQSSGLEPKDVKPQKIGEGIGAEKPTSRTIQDGAVINGAKYPMCYTVTIPSKVTIDNKNFTGSGNVNVSNVNIEDDMLVHVKFSTEGGYNSSGWGAGSSKFNFILENEQGVKILYKILSGEKEFTDNNNEILTTYQKNNAYSKLDFIVDPESITYAGDYTGILNFNIKVKEDRPL